MTNPRDSISSHPCNDDPRHWIFVRDSKIPLGYFPRHRWISPRALAEILAVTAVVAGIIAVWVAG